MGMRNLKLAHWKFSSRNIFHCFFPPTVTTMVQLSRGQPIVVKWLCAYGCLLPYLRTIYMCCTSLHSTSLHNCVVYRMVMWSINHNQWGHSHCDYLSYVVCYTLVLSCKCSHISISVMWHCSSQTYIGCTSATGQLEPSSMEWDFYIAVSSTIIWSSLSIMILCMMWMKIKTLLALLWLIIWQNSFQLLFLWTLLMLL